MQPTQQEAGLSGQDRTMSRSPRHQASVSEVQNALREFAKLAHSKGIAFLRLSELKGLACVWTMEGVRRAGSRGYYKSIAHHTDRRRFNRHDFIVTPDSPCPTHDELYAIALATVTGSVEISEVQTNNDITDTLRAKLTYPKNHAKVCRLLRDLGIAVPERAEARYKDYVMETVTGNLLSPWHEAPSTRAMRIKLVFIDALPSVPDDPRLTDFDALVKLAEAVAIEAV